MVITCGHCGTQLRENDPDWDNALSSQRCPVCGYKGEFKEPERATSSESQRVARAEQHRPRSGRAFLPFGAVLAIAFGALYLFYGAVTPCGILKNRALAFMAENTGGLGILATPLTNTAIDAMSPIQCIDALSRIREWYKSATFEAANLEWQRMPPDQGVSWTFARNYCTSLALAGGEWRLPTDAELAALYNAKRLNVEIASYPGMNRTFWTSTKDGRGSYFVQPLADGSIQQKQSIRGPIFVRCVR